MTSADWPRVVIVGTRFGGLCAARAFANSQADGLVLERNNYHTFLLLLYQVAAAELEPEDFVFPILSILRGQKRVRFPMNEVTRINLAGRQVNTTDLIFPYDYLILALGCISHFFGILGAGENAFQLKTLEQAIALRNHILLRYESALYETDVQKRRQMLTFTFVGGGPTGVEFTESLVELIRGPLENDYPQLDFKKGNLTIMEMRIYDYINLLCGNKTP